MRFLCVLHVHSGESFYYFDYYNILGIFILSECLNFARMLKIYYSMEQNYLILTQFFHKNTEIKIWALLWKTI